MHEFRELSRSVVGSRVLAIEGAIVAVADATLDGAELVASEIRAKGRNATAWKFDVSDGDEIKSRHPRNRTRVWRH